MGILIAWMVILVGVYIFLISDSGKKVVYEAKVAVGSACLQWPRGFTRVQDETQGFLLVLYSVSREDRGPFVPKRLWGEFARLLLRIREHHPSAPIAVVVDDFVEAWFNGGSVEGAPPVKCAFNYDLLYLVDTIINGERDPRSAASWAQGKQFIVDNYNTSRGGSDHILLSTAMQLTPWNHTIYLDADVMICGGLNNLFRLLPRFDAAMVPDANRAQGGARVPEQLNKFKDEFALINLGLFVYDITKPAVKCLLEETVRLHFSGLPAGGEENSVFRSEREAFMGALWKCREANVWVLQDEWVCFQQTSCSASATRFTQCKIVHTHELYLLPEFRPGGWKDDGAV